MSETKTIVVGNDTNNSILGLITALCNKQGVDLNVVLFMMNNRGMNGADGGWFMWIIFLFFIMGWGNNGFGGFGGFGGCNGEAGLVNLINNDSGRELFMQVI